LFKKSPSGVVVSSLSAGPEDEYVLFGEKTNQETVGVVQTPTKSLHAQAAQQRGQTSRARATAELKKHGDTGPEWRDRGKLTS